MQSNGTTPKRPRMPLKRRAILALDLDCFYASVAIRARPHLAEKPVVIVQKHLCVTSNYVARSRAKGAIQKMTPVSKALAVCPELVLIDGSDLTPFREASLEVRSVIRAWLRQRVKRARDSLFAPSFNCPCQRLGFDEVFIDISPLVEAEISAGGMPWKFSGHVFGVTHDDDIRRTLMVASQLAHDLRTHVIDKTRLTLSAGIGDSKLLAKFAVNMNKPNDQTTFLPDEAADYISRLHPRSLPGIGHSFHAKMHQWAWVHAKGRKIEKVNDILSVLGHGREGIKVLSEILGSTTTAQHILALCKAEDTSPVVDSGDAPKSISSEDSFRSCTTMSELHRRITTQTTRLVRRLRHDGEMYSRYPRTLTVSYRFRGQGFVGTTRSVQMPMEIVSVCCSKQPGAEEKAVAAVQQEVLTVLKEHANIGESSPFDLTLFAVGASNFTDKDKATAKTCTQKISEFFKQDAPEKVSFPGRPLSQLTPSVDAVKRIAPPNRLHTQVTVEQDEERNEGETIASRCPICNVVLSEENTKLNSHIDRCLGIKPAQRVAKRRRTKADTLTVDSFFRKA